MPANFFEEVDSTGVVEDHIQRVLKLEHSQAESIIGSYRELRRRLVDRLAFLPRGTFTAQHLRGTLAQVEGAITAMTAQLNGDTIQGATLAATEGVSGLIKELKVFDEKFTGAVTPINLNAALVAQDTANLLVARYKTNLAAYGNGLYTQIANGLFSAVTGEATTDEVVGRISKFFNGKEWELHRIVRTELHHVVNIAKMNGMKELIGNDDMPDLLKTLMHPMDARTGDDSMYAAKLNLVSEVSKPFEYTWNGAARIFMAPPDRPNDRSVMVPYRKEWGSTRGDSFLSGWFPAA